MQTKYAHLIASGAAAVLLSSTAWAVDCNAPSAGMPTAEQVAACHTASPVRNVQSVDPSDTAFGADGVLATCTELTLNNPGSTNDFGFLDFRPACEFAGADFDTLFCVTFDVPGVLTAVNTNTCEEVFLGPLSNTQSASGLAWDNDSATMFMSTTDITTSQLFRLNLAGPSSTLIGTMTDSPGNISIMIDTDGQMYGHDIVTDALHAINKNTAASSLIGPTGFDANFAQGSDCDDSDGTCYIFGFDNGLFNGVLFTVDTNTGAATSVGIIGNGIDLREITGAGIESTGSGGANVGGSVTGVNPIAHLCRNLDTGQQFLVFPSGSSWSCTDEGLITSPGDLTIQYVTGRAL